MWGWRSTRNSFHDAFDPSDSSIDVDQVSPKLLHRLALIFNCAFKVLHLRLEEQQLLDALERFPESAHLRTPASRSIASTSFTV